MDKIRIFNKYDLRKYTELQANLNQEKANEIADKIRIETERVFCISLSQCSDIKTIESVLSCYRKMSNCKQSVIY